MCSKIKTEKSFLNIDYLECNLAEIINELKTNDNLIKKPKIFVYGKECRQNRDIGFFSDDSIGYYYSGQLAKSQLLTSKLKLLLNLVNNNFNSNFNGILINKYNNGKDYIGPHSDDEKNLDEIGVISLSYGAPRKFRIRNKKTKKIILDINTKNNMLIHMGGDFQKEFTHEIPIESKIKEERYSFTFRKHKI